MSLRESDVLNLPEAPDFISRKPEYTVTEMIRLCEKMLPEWNKKRLDKKVPEPPVPPFVLNDDTESPERG